MTPNGRGQGAQLKNPLTFYIQETSRFKACYASGVPPALMGSTSQSQVQSDDKTSTKGWHGKRKQKGGGWDDLDSIKRQNNKMERELNGETTKTLICH